MDQLDFYFSSFQINASPNSIFEITQVTRDFFKILVCPGIRNPDLRITSPMRTQLSYRGSWKVDCL